MNRKKKIVLIVFVLFCILQLVPINRSNPPVEADIIASSEVKNILKKSCYDCHSNETKYPIYSYLFPISIILKNHIVEARSELNFSVWEKLSISKRALKAVDITKEIKKGDMPLFTYTVIHRNAILSEKEIQIIEKWAKGIVDQNESE